MSENAGARRLALGTRGSRLALCQAEAVARLLEEKNAGLPVEIRRITTSGDKILDSPLSRIGGQGLFVKEIENALIAGEIDLAVHSAKDLPTELPEGLEIAAFSAREDPRDAFIGGAKSLDEIPAGGRVGTSSLRRRSQLLSLRPGLEVVDIRGNVDTRIMKIGELGLDGTILAAAGLKRLGREEEACFFFSEDEMIPAVGQGIVAIQVRQDDAVARQMAAGLNHPESAAAARAERALMRRLEGGCQVPIGAHATVSDGRVRLGAFLGSLDGSESVRDSIEGSATEAEALGKELAERMYKAGGREILESVRG